MKKLSIYFIISFLYADFVYLNAQRIQSAHQAEVTIKITRLSGSYEIIFKAEVEKWNDDLYYEPRWDENYDLVTNDDYTIATDIVTPPYNSGQFDLITDLFSINHPILAIAKYKITAIANGEEKDYFYYDLRTSDYGAPSPDVTFTYNYRTHKFMYNSRIISGTTQQIWDLVQDIAHVTSGLELYLTISNNNGHPKLSWNAFNSESFSYYQIFRKYGGSMWGILPAIVDPGEISYTDLTVSFAGQIAGTYVQYKVYPFSSSLNAVSNSGGFIAAGAQIEKNNPELKEINFDLAQNYPNPFNPLTVIKYTLPNKGYADMNLYSISGEFIVNLLGKFQDEGEHEICFNGENLTSGVYIYNLSFGNYYSARKMILIR